MKKYRTLTISSIFSFLSLSLLLNKDHELLMFDDETLMLFVRHINKTQQIRYKKSESVCS
jgi:hypothetical protein